MKLCVTGALGHIGSYLIRNLSLLNLEEVYLVDNFLTQRYCSLFELPNELRFIFREMDIFDEGLEEIIKKCDVVVHLAAITDAASSFEKVELTEKTNQDGVAWVAHLCAKHRTSLIFPSSTSVYGSQATIVDETCEELLPQSPYAETKRFAEKLLPKLAEKEGLNFITFRFGTIFGYSPGMRFHTAVNKFAWQAATNQKITVWKTALDQKRPYLGLNDAVNAINHVIENNLFDGEIYNIVSQGLTVRNVIDALQTYIPEVEIELVEHQIMNQLSYDASNEKSILKGYKYSDRIETALEETIRKLRNVHAGVLVKNI